MRKKNIIKKFEIILEWLGNEVGCGVGMRKIDLMLSLGPEASRYIVPIELKCKHAEAKDVNQLERYVEWIRQYYIPNRQSDIEPVILSQAYSNK
jgi:RecB family endonuclease NucS